MDRVLSIIIPVYEAKDTLERCVQSCLAQKDLLEKELEVILVDDGSTDGSSDLCDELAAKDQHGRIKVKHTRNFGVSHARNIGLEMAEGDYITFVDADDTIAESFAEDMLRYLDESTVIVDETDSYASSSKISGYQYIENSILNRNTHVWGKLFKRQTLRDGHVMFKEGLSIGEDLLFMLDIALLQGKERTIRLISGNGYNYEENEASAMNRAFKESYMDQLVCWKEAEDRLLPVAEHISHYAFVSVAASQIMTALLVVGKLAVVPEDQRDADITNLVIMRVGDQIEHALKVRGAFAGLSAGYKVKVLLFRISPKLYLKLYGGYKK